MKTRPAERAFSLAACAVMFLWPVVTTDFQNGNAISEVVAFGAALLGTLIYFRRAPLWLVPAFAVVAGTALRLWTPPYSGSDVVRATTEALQAVAAHANPYLHYYRTTDPPGQPFPYLPGELALYAIQHAIGGSLDAHDRWWGIGALLGFAALTPVCGSGRAGLGTALFAVSSTNILMAEDGSNDTGLLFLLIFAIVALVYAVHNAESKRRYGAIVLYALSAAFFGWAIAFKALVWIAFPFVLRALARERRVAYAAVALGVVALFCLPYAIASPIAFFESIARGFTSHGNVWGFNLWAALNASYPQLMDVMMKFTLPVAIFATLFAASTLWTRAPRTLGEALLQSCVVLVAMLFFARWTSTAYFAYLIGTFALAIATFAARPEPAQFAAEKR